VLEVAITDHTKTVCQLAKFENNLANHRRPLEESQQYSPSLAANFVLNRCAHSGHTLTAGEQHSFFRGLSESAHMLTDPSLAHIESSYDLKSPPACKNPALAIAFKLFEVEKK
jgi:hypothetical protein